VQVARRHRGSKLANCRLPRRRLARRTSAARKGCVETRGIAIVTSAFPVSMPHRSRFLLTLLAGLGVAAAPACAHTTARSMNTPGRREGRTLHTPAGRAVSGPLPVVHRPAAAREGSKVALAQIDGRTVAYVADEDDSMIRVIDVDEGVELSNVKPGGIPSQLVLDKSGKVIATLRDSSEIGA
jgi:hypothetical protein